MSEAPEASAEAVVPAARNIRVCDLCGGVDDHPRHVIAHPDNSIPSPSQDVVQRIVSSDLTPAEVSSVLADLYDGSLELRHMDCCRAAGCPDNSCNLVTNGAEDLKGPALLEHLTKGS